MPGKGSMARAIMFQGTGSNVGKSILVAGLLRALRRRGYVVRPFKPQNMSNNAAVTPDGGEIGRAQALQARAAGVAPSVDMNPVLLKPSSDIGSQVVVQGKVFGTAQAREYQDIKGTLLPAVLDSFQRLKDQADFVLVEGAGSASEINLRARDIANMGFARSVDVPVILIGDIDRGGVIASVVGTKAVIDTQDAALVCGFIVNKMRGDPSLFEAGMAAIAERTGWPAIGLVPFFDAARHLPAEDSYDLEERSAARDVPARPSGKQNGRLRIAVPHLPRIANFDDLDPLMAEPSVDVLLINPGQPLPPNCDVVILPGSKATIADLASLRDEGWDIDLIAHLRQGGHILGLCGGYQMLGRKIADPDGLEGPPESVDGLGLLNVETVLQGPKKVTEVSGSTVDSGTRFQGYEIHMGLTTGPDTDRRVLEIDGGANDGARSPDGRIVGCYVHGLFSGDAFRAEWLGRFNAISEIESHDALIERTLDGLADHLEGHLDIDRLITIAR